MHTRTTVVASTLAALASMTTAAMAEPVRLDQGALDRITAAGKEGAALTLPLAEALSLLPAEDAMVLISEALDTATGNRTSQLDQGGHGQATNSTSTTTSTASTSFGGSNRTSTVVESWSYSADGNNTSYSANFATVESTGGAAILRQSNLNARR